MTRLNQLIHLQVVREESKTMPQYKVLVNNEFGEGWQKGDVIEMDTHAADVRCKKGHLELYTEPKPQKKTKKAK